MTKRFWVLRLDTEHKKPLDNSFNNDDLVGLVDEEKGGIIAYVLEENIEYILSKLK